MEVFIYLNTNDKGISIGKLKVKIKNIICINNRVASVKDGSNVELNNVSLRIINMILHYLIKKMNLTTIA